MIKVEKHGNLTSTIDPATGRATTLRIVVFVEEGRGGSKMAKSSELLSEAIGEETGLPARRRHSHGVKPETIDKFPVGMEIKNLFINRGMHSTPQMRQQIGDDKGRTVDGQLTFVTTWLDKEQKEDIDQRIPLADLLRAGRYDDVFNTQVGAADVRIVENNPTSFTNNDPLVTDDLGNVLAPDAGTAVREHEQQPA